MGARIGRYETLQAIASGGMATVHLARTVGAGGFERLVAIKVMHPGLVDDPEFTAMFLDEARVAARIRHPNVVGTLDLHGGPDAFFLVMEYVEGPALANIDRALWPKQERIPIGVGLRIVIDALLGLHAAHEQTGPAGEPLNIVHRDVSPHNILVGVDGLSKLTDFGVARAESRISSTRRGALKGKIAYMSPQQLRAEPIDRRADVYAAGVVLWEQLVGGRIFDGDSDGALVMSVLAGPRSSPRQARPSVPERIDAACMRALRPSPDERFPTALAFAEALEDAAQASGLTLATPRVVSAFVKALGAHKVFDRPPLPDGSAAGQASSQPPDPALAYGPAGSTPCSAATLSAHPPVMTGGAPVPPAPRAMDAQAPPPAADVPSAVSSVLSTAPTAPTPRRSRARMVATAAGFVGLAALCVRFLGHDETQTTPVAPAAVVTATAATTTQAPPSAPSADPAPSASASAAATASSAPNATASATAGARAAATGVPHLPTRSGARTGWRPQGL